MAKIKRAEQGPGVAVVAGSEVISPDDGGSELAQDPHALAGAGDNLLEVAIGRVAAAYLTAQMDKGRSLGQALKNSFDDLDGFYTFVVGTKSGFGVLCDPIACKAAVLAETDQYVAFGS